MKRKITLSLLAIGVGLALLPLRSEAQNVRDFTEHEPTTQELIDVLKPRTARPRTRGLVPVTGEKPQCEYYRKQMSRGIGPAPDSDAAALKVTFAYNSAQLTKEAEQTLDTLGEAFKSSELGPCCFRIEGHTDSKGGDTYNLKLSERRAQSAVRYLAEHFGVEKERMMAVGYGKKQPIADNENDEGRQKNRRVQVVNLGYGKQAANPE